MYSEEKIDKILDSLIEGTKSGYIKWGLTNSVFNSDTRHKMTYQSDDKKTNFDLEIRLENDLISLTKLSKYLYIKNSDLVNNSLPVSSNDNDKVRELEKILFEKFIKPKTLKNLPKKGALDDILVNINKQHMRQEKIDNILEDEEIEAIQKEVSEFAKKKIKEAKSGIKPDSYRDRMLRKVEESKTDLDNKPKRKKFLGIFPI